MTSSYVRMIDWNALTHPAVIITLAGAFISLIFWFARLEGRINQTVVDIEALDEVLAEVNERLSEHERNSDIHFNLRISQEVDRRNEQRFQTIERQLGEINRKLDRLAGFNER